MERYSDVAADILNDLHTERLAYNSEYVPLMDAINRLAEYEDTGLEPEEIKEAYRKGWQRAIDEIAYEEQAGTILVENPLLTEYVKLGPHRPPPRTGPGRQGGHYTLYFLSVQSPVKL